MAIIASGQTTIIDLYDATQVQAFLTASQGTSQVYNNTTGEYSPNFETDPLRLNLTVVKNGDLGTNYAVTNFVTSQWYLVDQKGQTLISQTVPGGSKYWRQGTNHSTLVVSSNVPLSKGRLEFLVAGTLKDATTGESVPFSTSIVISAVQTAKSAFITNVYTPDGFFFRNGNPSSLTIKADVYQNGFLSSKIKRFKWFAADSSVFTSQDPDAGIGWRKLTSTTGSKGQVVSSEFNATTTGQGEVAVFPDAVVNSQTYLVVVLIGQDGQYGKSKHYVTLNDTDDPILTIIQSTGGNVLRNGQGSTDLTARLFQNGQETDVDGSKYSYTWTKWQNNQLVPDFGGTGIGSKTGKTLKVLASEVGESTTFKVEVN